MKISEEFKSHLRKIGFKKGGDARRSDGKKFQKGHPYFGGRPKKGTAPWNKGKKGMQIAWNKGKTKETDERVKKYSKKRTKEFIENLRKIKTGKKCPWVAGEKNPTWRGGITPHSKQRLNTIEWRTIRRKFLLKFKNCQICNGTKRLSIHHKVPWAFGGKNTKNNLILLCGKCHAKEERKLDVIYGIKHLDNDRRHIIKRENNFAQAMLTMFNEVE